MPQLTFTKELNDLNYFLMYSDQIFQVDLFDPEKVLTLKEVFSLRISE